MNLVSVCTFRLHSFVKTGFEPKPVCVSDYALIYLFVSFMNVSLPSTVTQATHKLHHNIVMERKYRDRNKINMDL